MEGFAEHDVHIFIYCYSSLQSANCVNCVKTYYIVITQHFVMFGLMLRMSSCSKKGIFFNNIMVTQFNGFQGSGKVLGERD